ncbi:autotransporter assembly complex protein TamA [Hansschlegelia plantiphila]|uniref:autotransporter assembly complex protein TamA n=1 Tax=Hansschlegelia plantiphila TaxID=374655 RepID=UPI0022F297ED|nr:autotransporter assembly complex family protein [Hansschlegelia plantiphila]
MPALLAAGILACTLDHGALAQAAPSGPPPAAAAAVPGIPYVTTFAVDGGDADVEKIASETSSLKSLEKEVPPGPPGLVGRGKADIERIAAALTATGRYAALVEVTIAGVSVASESAADAAQRARRPAQVVVRVHPGPVFTLGNVRIQSLDAGSSQVASIDPAKVGLVPGQPAPSSVVFAAESRIVDKLRNEGYPFAAVKGRDVVADHSRNQLDVTIRVEAGVRAPFGDVTVTGTREVDPKVVLGRVPFKPGDRYSPKKVAELRDEVNKLDVFGSIRIREATAPDAYGRVPITIEVEEKKFRYVGASALYDSIDGASLGAYWGHRNLFGGAEKLRIDAGVSRLISNSPQDYEYSLKAHFEKPGVWTGFDDLLVDVEALRERPDAYDRDGIRAAAAIRRRLTSELSIQGGVEAEGSTIRDTFGEKDFLLVGLPVSATFDNTDSKLDPSRGVRATLSAAPYYNFQGESKSLNIFKGQVSSYLSFDEAHRFILAGKIGFGSMVGPKTLADVPANRRFFAGGGGSIRGFAYQSASPFCTPINPRPKRALACKDDTPIGGRSLIETSLEARVKITDTIGIVPFVDAGAAFDKSIPDFKEDIRVGAGIGLRYYTAIGPIRADIATPVMGRSKNDPRVAFYISIGQAF